MNQTALLKNTNIRLILTGNIFASMGSGMTMIAVPFYFVQSENGPAVFGYVTISVTIFLFLTTPAVGSLVDRFSRKALLLGGMAAAGSAVGFMSLIGFSGYDYHVLALSVLFVIASLYYHLFYPTIFALNQELFTHHQYKALNGLMEIQGQLAAVLSGLGAALLIPVLPLHYLLLINAATFAAAMLFISRLPSTRRKRTQAKAGDRSIREGIRYLRVRPLLFLFLMASFMPFIGVMVTNYLFPVYIEDVLRLDASAHGMKAFSYGVGAVLAGYFMPMLLRKWSYGSLIMFLVSLFTVVTACFLVAPGAIPFYVLAVFFAIGNAGTRVARSSFMMDTIPNAIIGRVDGVFRTVGLALRIMLLTIFTQLIAGGQMMLPFYLLVVLLASAVLGVWLTKRSLAPIPEAAPAAVKHASG